MKQIRKSSFAGLLIGAAVILSACVAPPAAPAAPAAAPKAAEPAKATEAPAAATAKTKLTMWYHGAGNEVERKILTQIVDDFNASQDKWTVERQDFPQASYNDSIVAGALAKTLPDIIDVDGPVMPNWAWSGYMSPLELAPGTLDKFLPGAIGKWEGKVYSVGLWDAACAIFARKSVLEANGIRIPTLDKPWTFDEFDAALVKLKDSGKFEHAIDLGMAWTGEWYPYAFSPFLQSFGGDIVSRETYLTSDGALNGPAAQKFGAWWKSVFERKLAPGTSQPGTDRDKGFIDGKYALQWNGNWAALGALEKFGDDLLFLPAPDFGKGSKIGAASWQFGVSASSANKEGAMAFIQFAIQDKYLAAFSDGIGLIPATLSAAALTKNYKPGGPLEVFFELSNKQGLIRPPTPAYLSAAKTFEKALADIANGADVEKTLDTAADEITADIEKNKGYGFK
jgi:multiple sugar transport system substrate-binding protein